MENQKQNVLRIMEIMGGDNFTTTKEISNKDISNVISFDWNYGWYKISFIFYKNQKVFLRLVKFYIDPNTYKKIGESILYEELI